MPNTEETRGLLAKNSEIRNEMLKRKKVSSNGVFLIEGKEEYQETFNSDSKLYDIGAERYMSHMSLNAYLNKDRYLEQKYITPSLTEFYGSNPQITGNIGYFDLYKAHNGFYQRENGRIVDDYNDGVHFINVEGGQALDEEKFYFLLRNLKISNEYQINKKLGLESDTYTPNGINYPNNVDESLTSTASDSYTTDNKYEELYGKSEYLKEIVEGTDRSKGLLHTTENLFKSNQIRNLNNTFSKRLKKKGGEETDYLRNWNNLHAYDESVKNFAGNYKNDEGNLYTIEEIQKGYDSFRPNEQSYLSNNSVLQKTGFVNIVRRPNDKDDKGNVKKCMFSIENLAWKDVPKGLNYLSPEQIGPNGGRIMWFPPYDISFDESVNVNWNSNTFIGRGEKVYTYTDTERNASLSFLLLIDHPNIINEAVSNVNDIDEDILRFFNGEQLLEVQKQETLYEDVQKSVNAISGNTQVFSEDKNRIEFSIYFPKNYSGMYLYDENDLTGPKYLQTYLKSNCIDSDWWIYLLIGRNTDIESWNEDGWEGKPIYPSEWRGYEIAPGKGLTDFTQSDIVTVSPVVENKYVTKWREPDSGVILNDTGECYYYRVDYDMRERLNSLDDYKDFHEENSMLNNFVVPTTTEVNESDSDGVHFSGAEAIVAIASYTKEGNKKFEKLISYVTGGAGGMEPNIDEIREKLNNSDIESIKVVGKSSFNEGSNFENSKIIAMRRACATAQFLTEQLRDKKLPTINLLYETANEDDTDEKRARRVDVVIKFKAQGVEKLSDTAIGAVSDDNGESGFTNNLTDNPGDATGDDSNQNTSDGKRIQGEPTLIPQPIKRYETEADYFKAIKDTDPIVYKNITEKLKYFNPAFHSISPEGFNARLTFIQQCTRQGHTIENSDKNGFAQTAGNLAFGRMPVCVLTLGDFINTRVLINSVTISYSDDGMQWDLNKTGVGVQPMFAKVQLQMHILGGQSLQGPISRLQNAVSFNYYANTGVYDDRADRAYIKEENGAYKEEYEKGPWAPYPDNSKN